MATGHETGFRHRLPAWVGLSLALLSGCATIPAEECAGMDWYALGLTDGRSGFAAGRIEKHREACAGVKVAPDTRAWEEGRRAGLDDYCVLGNALDQGLQRHAYEGVCADPDFALLYRAARELGDARYAIEDIDNQMAWRENELSTNKKLSDKRRAELRSELRDLERKRERTRYDRNQAERDLERVRDRLRI